jgi:radical SAM superfamily enzyme YgiQ (UPF0313 family)
MIALVKQCGHHCHTDEAITSARKTFMSTIHKPFFLFGMLCAYANVILQDLTLCPLNFKPENARRILLIFPKYSRSFGTFDHTFPLMAVKAFMPPQGLLIIAALLPAKWSIRFIDENVQPALADDFLWADVVFTSGMHIQRHFIQDIIHRAHSAGKAVVLGGASVSAAPEFYPDADYLHCGEVGEETYHLFQKLDASIERPVQQFIFKTTEQQRLPLEKFPLPAYHLINIKDYLLGSIQFSSGCPFTCEFCDIPQLYGRRPRMKSAAQIIEELDRLAEGGAVSIYFVDDNFIANPKAALELLPHLVEWQKKWDYQVRLSCEATMNITAHTQLLELMQQAFFTNIFIGIETPELDAIKAINKPQNLRSPLLEAIAVLNSYGMEVAAGMIIGFDTDTADTAQAIIDFTEQSNIPILTVNILYALPHTPLYNRLQHENRILAEQFCAERDSNIDFLIPYDDVVNRWLMVIRQIYTPQKLYLRYAHNARYTYPQRLSPKHPARQATSENINRALSIFSRIIKNVGIKGHYRKEFWAMCLHQLSRGKIETMFQVSMVAHHLILYAQECIQGKLQGSNYSSRTVDSSAKKTIQ